MAQRLPDGDEQGLQQFLNQSRWEWEPVREVIAKSMTRALGEGGGWIVADTGFPKQGKHSVGVARQYSGTLGKTGNCQIGVSLSYANAKGARPLEWALYLPQEWSDDRGWCERGGVPAEVPKPEVVVVDAGYGSITAFRQGLAERELRYVAEVEMNYRELKNHLGLDHFAGRG
jgi:SRSO17 transposase